MDADETIKAIADFLWDVLTEERFSQPEFAPTIEIINENPFERLADAGHEGITQEQFLEAIDRLALTLNTSQAAEIQALRATVAELGDIEPPPPPAPVTHVTRKHVTVVNENRTEVNEGDTNIDNSIVTEINAAGDVSFDQEVTNTTAVAEDGGVAVTGDVDDAAVNTGINDGVLAGDDVIALDSIVGDGNDQVNDTQAGAVSTGAGSATAAEGENVNLGSGELTTVDAGGDGQVVDGDANDVSGDVSVVTAVESAPADAPAAPPTPPPPPSPSPPADTAAATPASHDSGEALTAIPEISEPVVAEAPELDALDAPLEPPVDLAADDMDL